LSSSTASTIETPQAVLLPLLFETVRYSKKGFKFLFIYITPKVSEIAPIIGIEKGAISATMYFKGYLQQFIQ